MDDLWGAIGLYAFGVLTGAALAGWCPAFLHRWEARREQRRRDRTSERMRKLVVNESEKIKARHKGKSHGA